MASLATLKSEPSAPARPVSPSVLRRLSFHALGTVCEVQYVAPNGDVQAAAFERAAVNWVGNFEARYSRFRPNSLVSRINEAAGRSWIEVDEEMDRMLQLCDALFAMTQGVLDPTALPLIRLWNWKAVNPSIPIDSEIESARQLVGWTKVKRRPRAIFLPVPGMALDFGGFGKEYAVDLVAQLALEHGIINALVDFGHDIRVLGVPPGRPAWHVGLEDPQQPGRSSASLALTGSRGVASSGDYLRNFQIAGKRYGHIVDPRTGRPVANGSLQATIIAGTCLQAGILSTTAFVLGITQGISFIRSFLTADGLIVTDCSRAQTPGFYRYVAS